jgi:hypothetical protein
MVRLLRLLANFVKLCSAVVDILMKEKNAGLNHFCGTFKAI